MVTAQAKAIEALATIEAGDVTGRRDLLRLAPAS
jgi:hypothetical protein